MLEEADEDLGNTVYHEADPGESEGPTRVYLAGAVQHVDDGGKGWRNRLTAEYDDASIEFLNPLDKYDATVEDVIWVEPGDEPHQDTVEDYEEVITTVELVEGDKDLIDESDAVLLRYDDVQMWGSPMEMMYAFDRMRPVVVWDGRDDRTGRLSPWIHYHADFIGHSADEVMLYLEQYHA